METRQQLIDMVRGTRSGYWIEVLHGEDGTQAYMLHFPYDNGADTREMPVQPFTWDAVQYEAVHRFGMDADTLPKYDDTRRYRGDVAGINTMQAIVKWCK